MSTNPTVSAVKAGADIRKLGQTSSSKFGANRDAQVKGSKDVREEKAGL